MLGLKSEPWNGAVRGGRKPYIQEYDFGLAWWSVLRNQRIFWLFKICSNFTAHIRELKLTRLEIRSLLLN